ncbi:hypothetical protein SDC9_189112 [bioreactor metagenome]|uniref:Uncharacterized protein n=1 Tax=bioreactor metagenome TaxID=1076179 RepID=A0A645HTM9_9ZZZZ
MLGADGEANRRWLDADIGELLLAQLRVRGGRGMDHEALDIRYIGQQREELQRFRELLRLLARSVEFEGKDRRPAVGIVSVVKLLLSAGC